eukprot:TRINITY_DN26737_c0_g2_i1.p1 TRINITY_DN26737_c0_g2~~TRINITY_DN26737_c0_g2_i1.p1  ORF type:complete len:700 (-),score=155.08 TRINITY_DN26737_c0_g2_i1:127-2226(-)
MDNYQLVERLGQGSFAVVWKARRKSDQRLVAVKQLKHAPTTWEECKRLPEIRAAAAIRGCLHIIALLEAVRYGTELLLVLEYADTDLCRCLGPGKRFEEPQVRWAMRQLMSALAAVHAAGFVHCDVKPENLLLFARGGPGNSPVLKLCDLGQATPAGEVESYVGTRWYRAPELLLGIGKAGEEVDLWAAGCAMAELLLLRPVFPGCDTRDMLFRICSALGAPEDGWRLSEQLMEASGLRFAPCAAEGPVWFEIAAAGASPPAVELVRGLLRYQQERRLPAAKALQALFFAPASPEAPILPPDLDKAKAQRGDQMQRNRDEAKAVERKLHAARGGGAEKNSGGCWGVGLGGLGGFSGGLSGGLCGGAGDALPPRGAVPSGPAASNGCNPSNGHSFGLSFSDLRCNDGGSSSRMNGAGGSSGSAAAATTAGIVASGGLARRPPQAAGVGQADRRVAFGPALTCSSGSASHTSLRVGENPPGYAGVRGLPRPSSSKSVNADFGADVCGPTRLRGTSSAACLTGQASGSFASGGQRAPGAGGRSVATADPDGLGDSDDEELAALFWSQVESSRHALRSQGSGGVGGLGLGGHHGHGAASAHARGQPRPVTLSPSPAAPVGYGGQRSAASRAGAFLDGDAFQREDAARLPSAGVRHGGRRAGDRSAWEIEGGGLGVNEEGAGSVRSSRLFLGSDSEQDESAEPD